MAEIIKKLDTVEDLMALGVGEIEANFILAIEAEEMPGDLISDDDPAE